MAMLNASVNQRAKSGPGKTHWSRHYCSFCDCIDVRTADSKVQVIMEVNNGTPVTTRAEKVPAIRVGVEDRIRYALTVCAYWICAFTEGRIIFQRLT